MSKLVRRQCLVYLLVASLVLGAAYRPVKAEASLAGAAVAVPVVATAAICTAVIYSYFKANGLLLIDTTTRTGEETWDAVEAARRIAEEYNRTHPGFDLLPDGPGGPGAGWGGNLFALAGGIYFSYQVAEKLQALVDWYKSKYYIDNGEEVPVIGGEDVDSDGSDPFSNGKIRVTVANPPSGTTYQAYEGAYEFSGTFLLGDDGSIFVLATGTEGLNGNVSLLTSGTSFGQKAVKLPSGKSLVVEFTDINANGHQECNVKLMDEYGLSAEKTANITVRHGTGSFAVSRSIQAFYLVYMLDTLDYRVVWYGVEVGKSYADYYVVWKTDILKLTVDDVGAEAVKPSADVQVMGDPDIPELEDDGHSYMGITPSTGGETADEIADGILEAARTGGALTVSTSIADGTGWSASTEDDGDQTGTYTGILGRIYQAILDLPGRIGGTTSDPGTGTGAGTGTGTGTGTGEGNEGDGDGEEGTPEEELDKLGLPDLGEAIVSRFPFCIPWDVARGLRLIAAPPETPRFELDFFAPLSDMVPWQGSTEIVLDFEDIAIVGTLSRWTSTIGFCILLAMGTKKLIWTA